MNDSSRLSDRDVTDMLRWRSARPAPDELAPAILASLAAERAHPARTSGRSMKRPLLLLAAALLVGGGALAAGAGAFRSAVAPPEAPPSVTPPEPAPSAGLVDFPNLTTTFDSPRNGFSIRHPERVSITPAVQLWGFSKHVDDGFDGVETGLGAYFKGASRAIIDGLRTASVADAWVDEYLSDDFVLPGGCGVPRRQQAEIAIDRLPGRISECPNRIEATVVAGGRLYLFALLSDRSDARAVFDAFAATIDLTPDSAIDYPGLTTTFVSPTNGYSFGYLDRGGLAPAKTLWDPATQPSPDNSFAHDEPFDGVETGLGAYFKAASTPIPDGVSIDAWVDEYVSPGGCGLPRSQQAEVTIDGQPGRISECPSEIDATVVDGGRLYLFILLHDNRSDARAYFDAFLETIDLRPEDAAAAPAVSS